METRALGRTGLEVGIVGLGTEHLLADRVSVDAVFDLALPSGLNYVDVVYNDPLDLHRDYYEAIGPAIRRYRDRLVVCLHWGFVHQWPVERCERAFDAALALMGNGRAEVAMLTMVDSAAQWQGWAMRGIERLQRLLSDGSVRAIGLSTHNPDVVRLAAESGLVDVIMHPINLYQYQAPAARAAIALCEALTIGVVAMKPYYGGVLLTRDGEPTGITPAQCLHYVLSQPVAVAVPGPSNVEQMRAALGYVTASASEKASTPLPEELERWLRGQCVRCRHCLPCPQGIHIPAVITCLEYVEQRGLTPFHQEFNRANYAALSAKGSDCTACGVCESRCPFGVEIIAKMRRAVEVLEAPAS